MVDVFISYAREDQGKVQLLAERVQQLGYAVWWDRDLPPHKSYGDVISEKIGAAKAAIVVWSEHAAASQWVRAEADTAREQHKLIQTAIDDTRPPMPFNMLQFVMLGDWKGEDDHHGWRKVKESLAELCSADGDAEPAAALPVAAADVPKKERSKTSLVIALAAIAGVTAVAVTSIMSRDNTDPEPASVDTPEAGFPIEATIDDPDGFAYVRNAPARGAAVVGRVMNYEIIYAREQNADWWEVLTEDGVHGFVERSQIITIEDIEREAEAAAADVDVAAQDSEEAMIEAQADAVSEITEAMEGVGEEIEAAGQ